MGLSFNPLTATWRIDLPNGRTLWSNEIRSVYWRNYDGVGEVDLVDRTQNFIAHNDARSLFESFLIHLLTHWVNGWTAFQLHQTKPVQLARVAQLGVRIPATMLTNHADEVRRFTSEHSECVFKPVQGGDTTRKLKATEITEEKLASLRFAPITLQEAVPETNIRVFVAGTEVVACEVRTSFDDYRDDPNAELIPHSLPTAVAEICLRIARNLELRWTGIDFRLTNDKQYVFLEANPSPMFLGFESQTQLPLTRLLLNELLNH
jgi:glutathione synthase/RimK-type ligase-like ATP-grasp enzyme